MDSQTNLSPKVDLSKEYSPSLNSNRFKDAPKPHEAVVENFITQGKLGNLTKYFI